MPAHYKLGYLLLIAVPVAACIFSFIRAKRAANLVVGIFCGLIVLVVTFALTAMTVSTCADSIDIRIAAKQLLTPTELKTLHASGFICPTVFHFEKSGRQECLVSDHDGGAYVGCG